MQMQQKFDNSFAKFNSTIVSVVEPSPLERPRLAATVAAVKSQLGETIADLTDAELLHWLNGTLRLADDQRIATCYSGHQFGVWAGQLGDGRAMSLGEVINGAGERLEVQVKGLGQTPYSRRGDGRAVIRSSVREFLCAEYLHGLGIPTTRSLALLVSDTPVQRETMERGAVVARVFPSQVRFGHFEHLYHGGNHSALGELIEYVRTLLMPGFTSVSDWFGEVVRRTAHLLAQWQAAGFCHGVMNTDNMSILGITLDYGPFGFMGAFNPKFVCNHSDHEGRYSYGNQPRVALWNLQCLASCMLPFVSKAELTKSLNEFEPELTKTYVALMANKLGIEINIEFNINFNDDTLVLVAELLEALSHDEVDYHFFFSQLSKYECQQAESVAEFWGEYPSASEVRNWFSRYDAALEKSGITRRHQTMRLSNPTVVLHNHIAQEIIERVEHDDFALLNQWLEALSRPFEVHAGLEASIRPFRGEAVPLSCSS